MKFFNHKFNTKALLSTVALAFLFFLGSTHFTYAAFFDLGSVSSSVISSIAFSVSYVLAFIFGVLVAIEAWIIGVVLNINADILQTTLVQTGFSISLAIANLAFVLGIIVIAIATILRSQTYGIKQLLWKLVVMAILVNFGLVIMSPIFALGNSFTQYFLNCINPGAGGCSQNASGLTSFNNFGTTLASAFNPANAFLAPAKDITPGSTAALQSSHLSGSFSINAATGGASLGQSVIPLFGIIFVAIDLILIVIILGGFIALLTVRYLYIAILAILLPFAWASWVFPSFSSHWKRWWELFIRWTFFAPVVLLFVYLALLTMKGVGATGVFDVSSQTSIYTNPTNSTWTAISTFLTSAISPVITSFLQEILLGGLIVGGMMAANSMGIKLAGTVVNRASAVGKGIAKYTGSQSRKLGTWGYQRTDKGIKNATGSGLTERLQTGNVPVLKYIPGGKRASSVVARSIQSSSISSNSKIVEEAQKKAPKSWDVAKKNLEGSMNTEDQFAHIAVGVKEGKIKTGDMVNGKTVAEFLDNQDLVARYGQGKLVSDFDKVTLSNANSRRAALAIKSGDATAKVVKDVNDEDGNLKFKAGDVVDAAELKKESEREQYQNADKPDFAKSTVNDFFSSKAKISDSKEYNDRLGNLANFRPDAAPDLMRKMNAATLENFGKDYKQVLATVIQDAQSKIDRFNILNNLGDKRTKLQEGELEILSPQIGKIRVKLTRAQKGMVGYDKAYTSRFGSADHEEHGDDHGGEKHDDEGKGHGNKASVGGHSPAPKATVPKPSAPAPSGGGDSHGGGHH